MAAEASAGLPVGGIDIDLKLGDALVILGRRLPHHRPPVTGEITSLALTYSWVA